MAPPFRSWNTAAPRDTKVAPTSARRWSRRVPPHASNQVAGSRRAHGPAGRTLLSADHGGVGQLSTRRWNVRSAFCASGAAPPASRCSNKRLRLQFRRVVQQPLGGRPDCRQRIRSPPAASLFGLRPLTCLQVFGRRFSMHPCFHRRRAQHAGLCMFFHQSLVLLLRNHWPAWAPSLANVRPTALQKPPASVLAPRRSSG